MRRFGETNQPTEVTKFARRLVARGLFNEADDVLTTAMTRENAALCDLVEWTMIPSTQGEHGKALERLDFAKSEAKDVSWLRLEAQILFLGKSFARLSDLLTKEALNGEGSAWAQQALARVEALTRIQAELASRPDTVHDYAGYCINLDEQDQKWRRCQLEAALANLTIQRLPGVKGAYLPNSILDRLGTSISERFKGTLGCFLSHLGAWENFIKTDKQYALIVEDDFMPLIRFPAALSGLGLPPSFDICWITQRMEVSATGPLAVVEVSDAISRKATPRWTGCGTEGYILSRSGAAKLIDHVLEDGLFGDVDWRMMTYSLGVDQIGSLDERSFARIAMEAHLKTIKHRPSLASVALTPGLIRHADTGSIRERQNSGRHVHE